MTPHPAGWTRLVRPWAGQSSTTQDRNLAVRLCELMRHALSHPPRTVSDAVAQMTDEHGQGQTEAGGAKQTSLFPAAVDRRLDAVLAMPAATR